MLFKKKDKKCESCNSKIVGTFNYCPHCGASTIDKEKQAKSYGLLGKTDSIEDEPQVSQGFGLTDKLVNSLMNSVMRSMEKQFKDMDKDISKQLNKPEVQSFPNGIKIKIAGPFTQEQTQNKPKKENIAKQKPLSEKQIEQLSSLPKSKAKTSLKRLPNKVLYELSTPGVSSLEDIFVSKLEQGYEIKALGKKKVYVNSLPVELPLKKYSIEKNKLLLEFTPEE
ncbi:hypothetical protein CMI47_02230 [Candidatus Pacearchaeota archaeon]|nr:hypothetical protein [Candidatus Pacearchaeota archaeon]|tara:strand:- start:6196 stop:6867 length:672 start_codon:yes stop_codon:yes gene_type:complete